MLKSNKDNERLRIRLLGGFEIFAGSQEVRVDGWRLRKAASLVKLLALAPKCRMHREQLVAMLWPDLKVQAVTNNLHQALYVARRTLGSEVADLHDPHYLRFVGDELVLCQEPLPWVDVEAFRAATVTARYEQTIGAYQQAIELYTGDLLPGDRYERWVEERRDELRELYLNLYAKLAGLHEVRGDHGPGIDALERIAAEEPLREDLHACLMRLYALSGRGDRASLQYEHLRRALRRELDVQPGEEVRSLHTEILENKFPAQHLSSDLSLRGKKGHAGKAGVSRPHNLPRPRNSFVGREREMLEIKRSLAMTRVLTFTGIGGCGKTRLAVEVSRELVEAYTDAHADAYTDGVWFVWLAALSRPEQVPRAVAAALGVTEQAGPPLEDTLADHLESKSLLLIFDNCEHLVGGAARLADILLNACQDLKILATSREPLGIAGEVVWPIPTLSLPDAYGVLAGASDVESLPRAEAVRLFVNRARSRLPAFQLNKENAGAVARICRTLDGIPLAIELAAGRMGALSVEQVAGRLEGSLALLAGGGRTADPRHQTLRATLEWSHGLLSEPERALFRRLSVFAGLFTLEAAEDVCSDVWPDARVNTGTGRDAILDLISRLIDKSLVIVTATTTPGAGAAGGVAGPVGYRLLQPVRQYGLERLEESGEAERVRERHARHYLALAEKADLGLIGAGQVAWLERLATEYPDLRAALHWFLDEDDGPKPEEHARMGLRMAAALGRFWGNRGSSEGREWLEKGLAKSGAPPNSPPASLRAKALNEAGFIATYHLDPHAIEMFEEALALYRRLGDQSGQALSINLLGHTVGLLGNLGRAPTLRAEAEALLAQPLQDHRAAAYLHVTLGMIAMLDRDYQQCFHNDAALALFREVGDLRSCAQCLTLMGIAALSRGDAEDAARAYEQTLPLLRQLKDKIGIFYSMIGSAGVAVLRNRPARAARLFGAGDAARKAIGHPTQPLERINLDYESYLNAARAKMGETAFEAAFSEGQAMSYEQAIEYALSADEPDPPAAPVPKCSASALTRREREVALLVARGLTNRQVAGELTVSERTVTTHVDHILHKLGATSRSQVAAWIVEERLLPEEGRRTSDSR